VAASTQLRYYNGSSPSAGPDVTGTTVRYKRADNQTQDSNNPLPLSATTSYVFTWRKQSKINFTTSPASNITNLRFFMSSVPPTGIYFGAWLTNTYVQGSDAGDDNGVTGFTDTTGNQATNNATNYTSSSPLTINSGTVLTNPSTGEGSQEFLVTQMGCNSTYGGGPGPISPTIGLSYRYNET